jgi:hypothetical protein
MVDKRQKKERCGVGGGKREREIGTLVMMLAVGDTPDKMNKLPPDRMISPLACSEVLPISVHFSPRTDTMMDARPRSRAMIIRARHACM